MAFKRLTNKLLAGRRVLISGAPCTLKTTAILTWPKPIHIVSYPGEKGYETIPVGVEGVHPYVWEIDDITTVSPAAVVREVETLTTEILSGKYGEVKTFAGDGLHKLYGWFFQATFNDLVAQAGQRSNWDGDEEKLRGPAYGQTHAGPDGGSFGKYITKTLQTSTPYIVMTLWEGATKDNPDDTSRKATSHIFPDLPGLAAKRIVGEFGAVVYSTVSLPDPHGRINGSWQLRPEGKVWGVGVKVPPEIGRTLPVRVPQDFTVLEELLSGVPLDQVKAHYAARRDASKETK